ncbi:MAG: LCP family protein [Clostridia bacterium]|nr:LCP family protein [Clostridia bacterium]
MSNHTSHGEKKQKRKKILGGIAIALAIVITVSVALFIIDAWENNQGDVPVAVEKDTTVSYNGQDYKKKDNVQTLLIMGLDKYEGDISDDSYNNDQQADFLMLFAIDDENSTITAIHINRDTMAQISVLGLAGEKVATVNKQLALAHTYGDGKQTSCRNTAEAVSKVLLDTDIDHYISVTMDSVPAYNDLVGGVEVTILDDFTGVDDTLVKGETVTLMGEHALNYVRTRYGLEDSTNNTRMERQRQYLDALIDKTQHCVEDDEDFVIDSVKLMSEYMVSDCSVIVLQELFEKISTYSFEEIRVIEGENKVGEKNMEFYPDDESVKEIIMDVLYTPAN